MEEVILEQLKKIDERLERIEKRTQRMDTHITFVNSVYNVMWAPLEFIRNRLSIGEQTPLPLVTKEDLSEKNLVNYKGDQRC
jgi:hypothetical protein